MAQHIGLDLGAASAVIYQKGKGIVLREPSVAAVDTRGTVAAVGAKALLLYGRSPGTLTLRRPMEAGNITDFNLIAETLDRFLELAVPHVKKHVTAAVRYSFGSHNREVLTKALSDCRTGKITLVDSGAAALIGSGLAIKDSDDDPYSGTVVCDIGAGGVEVSYIRAGEVMRTKSVPHGGDAADAAIAAYLRRKYGLVIPQRTARAAKHTLSLEGTPLGNYVFVGTDGSSGMPRRVSVPLGEIIRPCAPQIDHAAELIRDLLSNLPHHGENISTAKRIVLVGGGAALPGIAKHMSAILSRDVTVADRPADCTALGLGEMFLQNGKR